jgi:UDP-N-acetylglucosamine--N-acetylmuramyl-(pentapeptide) pyrophosphoryl-undecaprenol N-acetylglucosamine transferase
MPANRSRGPAILSDARRTAVIAAGGTGGHLFPAQALAEALIARGWRIVLATDARAATHAGAFPAARIVILPAATFRRGQPLSYPEAAWTIARGLAAGRAALTAETPAVTIGFGGYPSLPALLAAVSQGRKSLIHEQNAVLGRANRLLAPLVSQVACGFDRLAKASPRLQAAKVVTGNPVRAAIAALAGQPYSPQGEAIHVLVTGGSQGARLLSENVPAALAALPAGLRTRLRVAQQARPESLDQARRTYDAARIHAEVAPFFDDMAQRLAWAHLVIGRAGASTVTELTVVGRPGLLIPLGVALDDDQGQNAAILAAAGAAVAMREADLTVAALAAQLETLLVAPEALADMAAAAARLARPRAAEALADLVERLAATG